MKIKAIIICLLLAHIAVSSYAQQKKVEVTYVGNAGFLINIGDKKILIDALFKGFKGNYELPQEIQDKLTRAQAPFDNIDLILVTHAHGDHVNSDMVRKHLQINPKAIFASTQQMVNMLNAFADRCIAFNPTKEKPESKVINGISIEAFYLPHGTNAKIINIGFLISVNGITIFQTGDADFEQFTFKEFRSLQLPERNIDLSFIQHYYLRGDSLSTKFVREAIGGNYIFPIHYHFTTPTFDTTIVRQNYPDAIIFKEELQKWQMPDKNDEFPALTEAYFGQTPPGLIPEVFAPGIVSDSTWAEHCQVAVSPNGDVVFWSAWTSNYRTEDGEKNTEQLFYSKLEGGKWTKPKLAEFSKANKYGLNGGPVFSFDGNKLFFYQIKSPWISSKMNTYYVEKINGKWSDEPIDVGPPYNLGPQNYSPMFTKEGNAYKNAKGIISKYTYVNEKFILVDTLIIHKDFRPAWNIYVSPMEDYVIFAAKHDSGFGDVDLYISFKKNEDKWGTPINMGDKINTKTRERFPMVSPDGEYLFFIRHTETQDFFWVSTEIIDELRKSEKLKN